MLFVAILAIFQILQIEQPQAYATELETYQINGKAIQFERDRARHLLMTPGCLPGSPRGHLCEATQKLRLASLKETQLSLKGGVNPGALVCKKLGGRSEIGIDAAHSQTSVCTFSDGTRVSSGTLYYYAYKNDQSRIQ